MLEEDQQAPQEEQVVQQSTEQVSPSNNPFMLEEDQSSAQPMAQEQAVQPRNYQVPTGQDWTNAGGQVIPSANSQKSNWFLDMVENFNRPFGSMAEGVMDLGASMSSNLGGGEEMQNFRQDLGQYSQNMNQSTQEAADRSPTASLVGNILGNIGVGATYGGPAISSAASIPLKMAAGAASGAGLGFADYAPDMLGRIDKGIAGGIIGGTIPVAIGLIKGAGKMLTPGHSESGFLKATFRPEKAATEDLASTIKSEFNSTDDAIKSVQSAQELMKKSGNKFTPGEVFPDTAGIDESVISPSKVQKNKQINPHFFSQQSKAQDDLFGTISKMSAPGSKDKAVNLLKNLEKEFFDESGKIVDSPTKSTKIVNQSTGLLDDFGNPISKQVNQESLSIPNVIKQNDILSKKYTEVLNAKSDEWKDLPPTSLAKFHKIKELIDEDLIASNPNKLGIVERSISKDDKLALKSARKQITKELAKSPNYRQAMKLYSNLKIQQNYENVIGIKATKAGNISTIELRQALLNKGNNRKQFINDVIKTGGDPEKAEAVIDAIDMLSKSPLERVVKQSVKTDPSHQYLGGRIAAIGQSVIDKMVSGAYTKAAIKLALDPSWTDKVIDVLQKQKGKEQLESLAGIMKPFYQQFYNEAKSQIGQGVKSGAALRGGAIYNSVMGGS